jgi:dihydroxyacid dehydratase/phosphogluconate dehydratase
VKAVESGSIKQGEKTVVVLRYLGPQGGPGEIRTKAVAYVRNARDAQTDESNHGCWSRL